MGKVLKGGSLNQPLKFIDTVQNYKSLKNDFLEKQINKEFEIVIFTVTLVAQDKVQHKQKNEK